MESAVVPAPPGGAGTQPVVAPPPAAKARSFHIPSLDGLRAVAFLIVFVAHAHLGDRIPGGFGVTVFFFLSGYLITTLLRIEKERTGTISLRDFYLRRALRILPPFYVVLLLAVLTTAAGVTPGSLQLKPMLALLGHFTNYWQVHAGTEGMPPGTGVYWSLAVEEHFYLAFPCLYLLLLRLLPGRTRLQAAVLLGLCAAVLAWRTTLTLFLHPPADRTYMATDARVDSILFGCALALGANPVLDRPGGTSWAWRYVLLPLAAAGLFASWLYRAPWFRESLRYSLQGVCLAPVFVVAMRNPRWGPFWLLNRRWVRHVGVLSYSLYLLHHVVIYGFDVWMPETPIVVRGALALAVALAISEAIHRVIEKPCALKRQQLAHTNWLVPAGSAPGP